MEHAIYLGPHEKTKPTNHGCRKRRGHINFFKPKLGDFVTTKPALTKIFKGLLHIEEKTRVRQEDSRVNKPFGGSRSVKKE
jgi:hypothetical protein